MQLDDDARHVHTAHDWIYDVPPKPEKLLHILSAALYRCGALGRNDDIEHLISWLEHHTNSWEF